MGITPRYFIRITNFPCHGCQKRRVGCHADCADYLEAKKQLEDTKTMAWRNFLDEKQTEEYVMSAKLKAIKRKRL